MKRSTVLVMKRLEVWFIRVLVYERSRDPVMKDLEV